VLLQENSLSKIAKIQYLKNSLAVICNEKQNQTDNGKNQNYKTEKQPFVGRMTICVDGDIAFWFRRSAFVSAFAGIFTMAVIVVF